MSVWSPISSRRAKLVVLILISTIISTNINAITLLVPSTHRVNLVASELSLGSIRSG